MSPSLLITILKTKYGRWMVFGVLSFFMGIFLLFVTFFINITSVLVGIQFDDTFYFPIPYATTPNEGFDPNRIVIHEYEITVDVPVLDQDGLPIKDKYGKPVTKPEIQQVRQEIPSPHWGVDFDLPEATYLVASRSGIVDSVYENEQDGKTIVVKYPDGYQIVYKHLSTILVSAGQEVFMGQPIGQAGMTGSCTPYEKNPTFHLHFEMKDPQGNFIDPMPMLQDWGAYRDFPLEQIKEVAQQEWEDWTDSDVPPSVEWDGTNFVWPVQGYTKLSSDYGYRVLNGVRNFHKGIDIPAPKGTPIYAAASGVVSTKVHSSYGIAVKISVDGKMVHTYGHMVARADGIVDGATVQAGQLIGYVGSTGQSTGNHLHFEVRINNQPTDPKPFFKR